MHMSNKGALLEASDETCGWTKVPARHKEKCWQNEMLMKMLEKMYILKRNKTKKQKGKYLEAKRKVKKAASCYNIAYNSEKGT